MKNWTRVAITILAFVCMFVYAYEHVRGGAIEEAYSFQQNNNSKLSNPRESISTIDNSVYGCVNSMKQSEFGNVHVRSEPKMGNNIIGKEPDCTRFEILGKDISGLWYQIDYKGQNAWMSSLYMYVENDNDIPSPDLAPTDKVETITPIATATPIPTYTPTAISTVTPTSTNNSEPDYLEGITIAPEDRCSDYDRDDYYYNPMKLEKQIVENLGAIYGPYSGKYFDTLKDTQVEHIVALSEAHDSGLCNADNATREKFASDLDNLTLASSKINRDKSNLDITEWRPVYNTCWYVNKVVQVKRKYGLTMDQDEANEARRWGKGCDSFDMHMPFSLILPTNTPVATDTEDALFYKNKCGTSRGYVTIELAKKCGYTMPVCKKDNPGLYTAMYDKNNDGCVGE